jgi:hypothetical protein
VYPVTAADSAGGIGVGVVTEFVRHDDEDDVVGRYGSIENQGRRELGVLDVAQPGERVPMEMKIRERERSSRRRIDT